ncbi:MAG: hypothetical protein PUB08_07635 [Firmicutes bacterium]|nr:hypothetical protein [Bacillota bacterium]
MSKSINKNQAVWDWVKTYPGIELLGFNFGAVQDGVCNLIPEPSDTVAKTYIDGTVMKYYVFAVTWYKDFATEPFLAENINDYSAVQSFIDWVAEQNKIRSFPDFGIGKTIDRVKCLQDQPSTSNQTDNLAKYMVRIRIEYIEEE